MRVKTRQLEGDAVVWDGSNHDELAAFAGDAFRGVDSSTRSALVELTDELLRPVPPGWAVIRWHDDGGDVLNVMAASMIPVLTEPA